MLTFLLVFTDSTVGGAAHRGDVKTAGRRTSAPPAVSTHGQQQRALLREKSKENQLDRISCQLQDSDKGGFDFGQYDAGCHFYLNKKGFLFFILFIHISCCSSLVWPRTIHFYSSTSGIILALLGLGLILLTQWSPGSVKDKTKEKPKQKDFLRIKLKKKKKKKKAKSGKNQVPGTGRGRKAAALHVLWLWHCVQS